MSTNNIQDCISRHESKRTYLLKTAQLEFTAKVTNERAPGRGEIALEISSKKFVKRSTNIRIERYIELIESQSIRYFPSLLAYFTSSQSIRYFPSLLAYFTSNITPEGITLCILSIDA